MAKGQIYENIRRCSLFADRVSLSFDVNGPGEAERGLWFTCNALFVGTAEGAD